METCFSKAGSRINPNLRSSEPNNNTYTTKRPKPSSDKNKTTPFSPKGREKRDREAINHTVTLKELVEGLANVKISGDRPLTIS